MLRIHYDCLIQSNYYVTNLDRVLSVLYVNRNAYYNTFPQLINTVI